MPGVPRNRACGHGDRGVTMVGERVLRSSRPPRRAGVFVYPVTSSEGTVPVERRRSPRQKVSSIIYARIGSDNGGIVIDLGPDGLACQAAKRMTLEGSSDLKLQLHGSGLDADLVGDLVWLGASKKEVGFRFKNSSDKVKKVIADWIKQEPDVSGSTALDEPPRLKPLPTIPGIRAMEKKSSPLSLSAALTMSKAVSMDPLLNMDSQAPEARLRAPLNSATGISGTTLLPESAKPAERGIPPAPELDIHPKDAQAFSFVSPEQHHVEQPLHTQPLLEPFPIEEPHQSPADFSFPTLLCVEPMPLMHLKLPQAPEKLPADREFLKTEETAPAPQEQVSQPPQNLLQPTVAERWIPPALLAAWRHGNRQQKLLLTNAAAACVLVFALVLTLTVAHTGRSSDGGALQQSAATSAVSNVSSYSPRTDPPPALPASRATARGRAHRPPPSPFQIFSQLVLGSEPKGQTVMDEDQIGVLVWTSKTSGYYYCPDSPFFNMVHPGAFMAQRDALQSGYQPRLGQICN